MIGLPFLYLDATELKACEARCATNRPGQAAPAWVTQASAAAIEVLTYERSAEDLLREAAEHWNLHP